MSGNVFVGDHIPMDVCLDSARRQLERLARDGVLLSASEHAYGEGITGLVETAGLAAGMSRLVGVQPGDLPETEGCARLWLRWEAIGSDGTLFPALDADLTLSPAGRTPHCSRWLGYTACRSTPEPGSTRASCAASPPSPSTALSPGSPVLSCIPLAQRFRQDVRDRIHRATVRRGTYMTGRVRTMKARQSAVERGPSKYATACDAIGRDAVSSDPSSSCLPPSRRCTCQRIGARRGDSGTEVLPLLSP